MRVFAVNRRETYEKTYFIIADTYEEAVEKLDIAFEIGSVLSPAFADDSDCLDEVSKNETDGFTKEYMMHNLDIKE